MLARSRGLANANFLETGVLWFYFLMSRQSSRSLWLSALLSLRNVLRSAASDLPLVR